MELATAIVMFATALVAFATAIVKLLSEAQDSTRYEKSRKR